MDFGGVAEEVHPVLSYEQYKQFEREFTVQEQSFLAVRP